WLKPRSPRIPSSFEETCPIPRRHPPLVREVRGARTNRLGVREKRPKVPRITNLMVCKSLRCYPSERRRRAYLVAYPPGMPSPPAPTCDPTIQYPRNVRTSQDCG